MKSLVTENRVTRVYPPINNISNPLSAWYREHPLSTWYRAPGKPSNNTIYLEIYDRISEASWSYFQPMRGMMEESMNRGRDMR